MECTGLPAAALYAVLGLAFFARLSWTLGSYPLVPLQTDDAEWSREWVWTTVGDYYTITACFCGVVLGTEEPWRALPWCAAALLGLGPAASCYVAARRVQGLPLQLESRDGQDAAPPKGSFQNIMAGACAVLGLATAAALAYGLSLLPPRPEDASWAAPMLVVTVVDYYNMALCFCAVLTTTDGAAGALWSLAVLLFGAPFGCAYAAQRLARGQPYRLMQSFSSGTALSDED